MRHAYPLTLATFVLFVFVPFVVAAEFDEAAFLADEMDDTGDGEASSRQGNAGPRANLSLRGSFENQLSVSVQKNVREQYTKNVYDYLQLRLDLDAELPNDIVFKSDVVARVFAGDTAFYLTEIVAPKAIENLLSRDPRFQGILQEQFVLENQYYLDNAYVKIPVGQFLLTLGKQPLGQGAGYVWNPTDVFTSKELLDPTYQKEGFIGAKLYVPMGDASLELVAVPDDAFRYWTAGGRTSFRFGGLNMSLVSYITRDQLSYADQLMDAIAVAVDTGQNPQEVTVEEDRQRIMVGGDVVVDLKGVRLWVEAAYNYISSGQDWVETEGGFEYYFPFETHLMIEYFYYGHGALIGDGTYDYNAWMNVLEGNVKMLGRQFLFESIDHPVADYWSLGFSSFQSLTDGSALIEADIKWDFAQDAQFWLMASKGLGGRNDFLSAPFQSWLRLKLFF